MSKDVVLFTCNMVKIFICKEYPHLKHLKSMGQILIKGTCTIRASQVALVVKNPPANAGDKRDSGLTPGSGRCPGSNPLQYL